MLLVNDEEKYDIFDCDPNIDAKELADILEELNESDREDMSMLVRRMRKFLLIILFPSLVLHSNFNRDASTVTTKKNDTNRAFFLSTSGRAFKDVCERR